jgi:AcrR family transcriptional regulator
MTRTIGGVQGGGSTVTVNHAAPARRKRTAEETEGRLLRAAEEIFGEKGYVDSTVADIVERADISRGAFYLYFHNIDDIFAALVSQVINDLFALSGARTIGTRRERVEAANRKYLEVFQQHRLLLRSFFQTVTFKPEMAKLLNEVRAKFIERIRRHIEQNMARGVCHRMNAEVASYSLGLMVEAVAYSWLSVGFHPWDRDMDFEVVVKELTDIYCRAVYKDGSADVANA